MKINHTKIIILSAFASVSLFAADLLTHGVSLTKSVAAIGAGPCEGCVTSSSTGCASSTSQPCNEAAAEADLEATFCNPFNSQELGPTPTTSTTTNVSDPDDCGGSIKQCIRFTSREVEGGAKIYDWSSGRPISPADSCGTYTTCTANALPDDDCVTTPDPSD